MRELGRGAMGVVLLADDSLLGRQVALKAVGAVTNGQLAAHVTSEARAIARLQHPNVVGLYDVLQQDGQAYLAMEYVEGGDLAKWLKGSWSARQRLELFVQVAMGLEAAHGAGVVHRDFKPANVLVGTDGRARVSDFGLAAMQGEHDSIGRGSLVGTPAYMAPEQFAGKLAGASADQFAYCAALFEALTGSRPYQAEDLNALRAEVQKGPPAMPPAIPPKVAAIIKRGLSVDPLARFGSMREVRHALEAALANRPRAERVLAAVGVVAVLTLAVVGITLRRADPCRLENTRMSAVWPAPNDATLSPAMRDTLGAVVKEWGEQFTAQCAAEHTESDWTRAKGCLEAILDDVESVAAASALIGADKPAEPLLQYVGRPHACVNTANPLRAALPRDPGQRRKVAEALAALAEITALDKQSDVPAQKARVETAVETALASGHAQTHARALLVRARLEYNQNLRDEFFVTLERARSSALASGAHRELARAGLMQAFDTCDGVRFDECGQALARLLPIIDALDDPWLRAWHLEFSLEANPTRVATPEELQKLVAAWKALPGADQELARSQRRLARAYYEAGRYTEALEFVDQLLPQGTPLQTMKEIELTLLRGRALAALNRVDESLALIRTVRTHAERLKLATARANTIDDEAYLLMGAFRNRELLALLDKEPRTLVLENYRLGALMDLGRFDEAKALIDHLDFPLIEKELSPDQKYRLARAKVLLGLVKKDRNVLSHASELLNNDSGDPGLDIAVLTTLGRESEAIAALNRESEKSYMLKAELAMRQKRYADAAKVLDENEPTAHPASKLELHLRRAACSAMIDTQPAASCARFKELLGEMYTSSYFSLFPNEVERISAELKPKCR
jgi:tetratricopeptide (TPR) repeat protein/predicted Ser/Thr protein kinase